MAYEVEKSFPFDSQEINGQYTNEYVAEDFARYFKKFISSGTFMNASTNLQVVANDDMTVTVKPGAMIIEGYGYECTGEIIINISPADGVTNRIDRISATWSLSDNDIHLTIQEGAFSYEPVAPECRRTAECKDYVIADVYVAAGAISISQADITDQRLNSDVCGLAIPFAEIDTSELTAQLQSFYELVRQNNKVWEDGRESEFQQWFGTIKGQLSEDAAGNLQNQINTISEFTNTLQEEKLDKTDVIDDLATAVAVTEESVPIGCGVAKEINNSLGGITQFIIDESTGKITGYKTKVGADTVFPFKSFEFENLVPTVLSKSITISDAIIGKHYLITRTRGTDLGISDTMLIKSGATTIWESECGITQYAGIDMAYVQATESVITVNGTTGKVSLIYFRTD